MMTDVYLFFDTVIDMSAVYLSEYGYKRSGKSSAFYKISADRKKGRMIMFKRSLLNVPDRIEFCIKCTTASSSDYGYDFDIVTVSDMKKRLSYSGLAFDIYRIDDLLAETEKPEDYFDKTVRPKLNRLLFELN